MSLSRWKMMAGVLGLSLGGLAAASQCPKDDTKGSSKPPEPPALELPPPMPTPPTSGPKMPPAPAAPPAPTAPATAPALPLPGPATPSGPDLLPPAAAIPSPAGLPMTPTIPSAKGPATPANAPAMPPAVVPASGQTPKEAGPALPAAPDLGPAPALPGSPGSGIPTKPAPLAAPELSPAAAPQDLTPPKATGAVPPSPPSVAGHADPGHAPDAAPRPGGDPLVHSTAARTPAAATVSKYRILLRVGEGEPTFEVKCGDDLLLKVTCEKVDIKSPEKGNGPSSVKASGKVRFAGFGAEGTCEELSFLAGTGEVSMAGAVKIHVKDKLGRVESELSTESVRYKIDPGAAVKP
jgi:hypothetical protein